MNQEHGCFVHKHRESDYRSGDGKIKFKALTSGDWTPYYQFNENQKVSDGDTDACIIFACQKAIDSQMDALMPTLPDSLVQLFNQMGFMDVGLDGAVHFHSSPRFLSVLTGNGVNGNALQDPWDVARKYGIVPWKDLPVTPDMTIAEYYAPISQAELNKGQQFLLAVGGKNWVQYHWVYENAPTDTVKMDTARQQSPLCIAVAAIAPDWNQYEPPINGESPCHGVGNINADSIGELISDDYNPWIKDLKTGWNINYVLQAVINIVPPPPAPTPPDTTLPPTPVQVSQWSAWLSSVSNWLNNLLLSFSGAEKQKLGGMARSSEWPALRKAFLTGKVCGVCGGTKKLEAHHVLPFHKNPSLELEISNLSPLCEGNKELNCHLMFGHFDNFATKWNHDIVEEAAEWNKRFTAKDENGIIET